MNNRSRGNRNPEQSVSVWTADQYPIPSSIDRQWIQNASCEELLKVAASLKSATIVFQNQFNFGICVCIAKLNESLLFYYNAPHTYVVDVKKKALLRMNTLCDPAVTHNQVLDLSDDGDRWEGDVRNDLPLGWGIVYDRDGRRKYEGFRISEDNEPYGYVYFADIERIEYEGEIMRGMRMGRGVQYDRNGAVVYDGQWYHNRRATSNPMTEVLIDSSMRIFYNNVREMIISDDSLNDLFWDALDFHLMSALRVLKIGDNCFENVREVKLIGMSELESVVIGKRCFTKGKGSFLLKKCPVIRELQIGSESFSSFSLCCIEGNPSLTSFTVAYSSFTVSSLMVNDLQDLRSITIEAGGFEKSRHTAIESGGGSCA